jgi:hypothetical protein
MRLTTEFSLDNTLRRLVEVPVTNNFCESNFRKNWFRYGQDDTIYAHRQLITCLVPWWYYALDDACRPLVGFLALVIILNIL